MNKPMVGVKLPDSGRGEFEGVDVIIDVGVALILGVDVEVIVGTLVGVLVALGVLVGVTVCKG
jgi:hypothetical protein